MVSIGRIQGSTLTGNCTIFFADWNEGCDNIKRVIDGGEPLRVSFCQQNGYPIPVNMGNRDGTLINPTITNDKLYAESIKWDKIMN